MSVRSKQQQNLFIPLAADDVIIHREMRKNGSKAKRIKCYFSANSGVSTLRRHIRAMAGDHWEAYKAHCVKYDLEINHSAIPEALKQEHNKKFITNSYVRISAMCYLGLAFVYTLFVPETRRQLLLMGTSSSPLTLTTNPGPQRD